MNNTHFFESYNYQIPLKPYKYWISLLSQSFYVVAAEIIMDADAITMAAVTTAAGLSSCFCSAAETTDVVATIAADLSGKKRQRLSPLPFLLPFLCFLLFLSFFLQTSQIYFIKSISINYQFLLLFRFHKTLQKNSSIYNMAAAGFPSYFHL